MEILITTTIITITVAVIQEVNQFESRLKQEFSNRHLTSTDSIGMNDDNNNNNQSDMMMTDKTDERGLNKARQEQEEDVKTRATDQVLQPQEGEKNEEARIMIIIIMVTMMAME